MKWWCFFSTPIYFVGSWCVAGNAILIYEIPKLVATILPLAMTPTLFDNNTFSKEDFMPLYMTDPPKWQSQTQELPTAETSGTNAEL